MVQEGCSAGDHDGMEVVGNSEGWKSLMRKEKEGDGRGKKTPSLGVERSETERRNVHLLCIDVLSFQLKLYYNGNLHIMEMRGLG